MSAVSEDNGFVERPARHGPGGKQLYDYDALIATAGNGRAVRVAVRGKEAFAVQNAIRKTLRARGYLLRYEDTKDGYLTAWAERRP